MKHTPRILICKLWNIHREQNLKSKTLSESRPQVVPIGWDCWRGWGEVEHASSLILQQNIQKKKKLIQVHLQQVQGGLVASQWYGRGLPTCEHEAEWGSPGPGGRRAGRRAPGPHPQDFCHKSLKTGQEKAKTAFRHRNMFQSCLYFCAVFFSNRFCKVGVGHQCKLLLLLKAEL